jgi:hypothetical protein
MIDNTRTCFVISPIGKEGSEVRKRADQVLKHIITPPVLGCGYKPLRADKISEPGLITSQVLQHILDDPLVIADLTGMNPNVFYELAIRHAFRRPIVQLCQKGEELPFDVSGMRTIFVDYHDLDSVEETKQEIERQIKHIEGKKPDELESPISTTVDLQTLKSSQRPEERTLGEILSAISELRSDVANIRSSHHESQIQISHELLSKQNILSAKIKEMQDLEMKLHVLQHEKSNTLPKEVEWDLMSRLRVLKSDICRLETEIGQMASRWNRI